MKYKLILLFALFISCKTIKKDGPIDVIVKTVPRIKPVPKGPVPAYKPLSTYNGDTLNYVKQNFIDRRAAYIDKPLSILLKDLELTVKDFSSGSAGVNPNEDIVLSLEFYSYLQKKSKIAAKTTPSTIIINWKTPLPVTETIPFIKKGKWSDEAQAYFGKQLVADIDMEDYGFDKK
ncbi:hypothetical protein ACFQ3S_17240 [Mucilaginibacter terrae]|uniref:hypothetical protein n=1 Tax=Mucilaginibacter terrae TaxID=1955052 RepID=UPI003642F1A8